MTELHYGAIQQKKIKKNLENNKNCYIIVISF